MLFQDVATKVENLIVRVHHVDSHIPKSHANGECQNHKQVDKAARNENDVYTIRKIKDKQSTMMLL